MSDAGQEGSRFNSRRRAWSASFGDVQESGAQGGGLGPGEFAFGGQELEPAGEVGGQREEGAPGLVDLEVAGGHQVEGEGPCRVGCRPRRGYGSGLGVEELQLPAGGVGGDGLVAVVGLLLVRLERALVLGVDGLAAHDHPHPFRPAGQVELVGDLDEVGVLARLALVVQGRGPHGGRDLGQGLPEIVVAGVSDGVLPAVGRVAGAGGDPGEELSCRPGAVGGWAADAGPSMLTEMWSSAVLDPADPGRSRLTRSSSVLSQNINSGWWPYPLKLGSAPSFLSECAGMTEASRSSTVTPVSSRL